MDVCRSGFAFSIALLCLPAAQAASSALLLQCDGITDQTSSLQQAIDRASAANQVLQMTGTTCITGPLTISAPLVWSGPGTVQLNSAAGSGRLLTITGSNVTITSIGFDGGLVGQNGTALVFAHDAAALAFNHNSVFNTVAGQYGFRAINLTDSQLQNNTFYSLRGPGASIDDGSHRVAVSYNSIDHTAASDGTNSGSGLSSQLTNTLGTPISDILFANNTVLESVHFCFESGNHKSGSTDLTLVSNIVFQSNTCTIVNANGTNDCSAATNPAACGGYSMALQQNSSVLDNTYTASGQMASIASVEVTACSACIVYGNVLHGGTPGPLHPGAVGISVNCNSCLISANIVDGFQDTGTQGGIYVHPTPQLMQTDDVSVVSNLVNQYGSNNTGIYANCNKAGGSIRRMVVMNNSVIGVGAGTGITAAGNNPSCILDSAILGPNSLSNLYHGYLVYRSANTTYRSSQFNSVALKFQDFGGSTYLAPYTPN